MMSATQIVGAALILAGVAIFAFLGMSWWRSASARRSPDHYENSMVELRDAVLEDGNTLERIHNSLKQGLLKEFIFHDHELALRHHYHTVVDWVERYDRPA